MLTTGAATGVRPAVVFAPRVSVAGRGRCTHLDGTFRHVRSKAAVHRFSLVGLGGGRNHQQNQAAGRGHDTGSGQEPEPQHEPTPWTPKDATFQLPPTMLTVALTNRRPPGESVNGVPFGVALTLAAPEVSAQSRTFAWVGAAAGVRDWIDGFTATLPCPTRPSRRSDSRPLLKTFSASPTANLASSGWSGLDVIPASS
ncbi:hypothetical protein MILUP08_42699 [Micromonospora lupini str. Lupac 08]|uniref:Uncharacterized protein n=1 Tax=Micromonospora lupini str. Lupac 08 TaxID=1150864 RepID=I0L1S1_9ACTN|nr:hypothetical protein MILUP08_42699 [Micromonospora lupini str. Lupac 08]